MTRVAPELNTKPTPAGCAEPVSGADGQEARNFFWLMLHLVLLRVGWIFKTESIVMPMFFSLIGGSSTLLGWLPVLNRIGLSVPPLLYARSLKLAPLKNRRVMVSTILMAAPFLVLSGVWFSGIWRDGDRVAPWMPYFFLVVYAAFFCITGMNQLGSHTLQGKLVRYDLRGRLFTAGVLVGVPAAVSLAWLLLPGWLSRPDGGFGWVFGCTAVAFVAAGLCLAFTREAPDAYQAPPEASLEKFRNAWRVLLHDERARPIAVLAMLVSGNLMLFPHYQSLYPREPGATVLDHLDQIMIWVCIQNVGTATFSLIAGPLADRLGNRAALRVAVAGLTTGPLLSLLLAQASPEAIKNLFWLVFLPLGFMPVTIKLLINYTLEAAPDHDHPRYVSAIGISLAAPVILCAPAVGWLVDRVGLEPVLVGGLVVLLLACWQTVRLPEPRHG